MPDFEATYSTAITKGGGGSAARNAESLFAWCATRGGLPGRTGQSVTDFINAFAAGYVAFSDPGTYSFTIPAYASLTCNARGAGGGGGGASFFGFSSDGGGGGGSAFAGLSAGGGGGGRSAFAGGAFGAAGGASGGTTNTAGGGSPGGAGGSDFFCDKNGCFPYYGGNGGNGGFTTRTYGPGDLTVGAVISVVVGAGGAGGAAGGAAGATGFVEIGWS